MFINMQQWYIKNRVKNGVLGHYEAGPEREDSRRLNLEEN